MMLDAYTVYGKIGTGHLQTKVGLYAISNACFGPGAFRLVYMPTAVSL